MGCCFCCLSQADKVGKVLNKFPPIRASEAVTGSLQRLVGGVVLASTTGIPLYAPYTAAPCVYFKIVIEEELEERDDDSTRIRWKPKLQHELCSNFYISDRKTNIFINGSNMQLIRVQSKPDTAYCYVSQFKKWPASLQSLCTHFKVQFDSGGIFQRATGRVRITEWKFEVGERVSALGVVAPMLNLPQQTGGADIRIMNIFDKDTLTEEYFKENGWTDWDKRSWNDLLESPAVLLSDFPIYTEAVEVEGIIPPASQRAPIQPQQEFNWT